MQVNLGLLLLQWCSPNPRWPNQPGVSYNPIHIIFLIKGYPTARLPRVNFPDHGQCYLQALNILGQVNTVSVCTDWKQWAVSFLNVHSRNGDTSLWWYNGTHKVQNCQFKQSLLHSIQMASISKLIQPIEASRQNQPLSLLFQYEKKDFFLTSAMLCSLWDLSSQTETRDRTVPCAVEVQCFNHWTTR